MREDKMRLLDSQIMACGKLMIEQSSAIARAICNERGEFVVVFSMEDGVPSMAMSLNKADVLPF